VLASASSRLVSSDSRLIDPSLAPVKASKESCAGLRDK
jgi:hypothetical protein